MSHPIAESLRRWVPHTDGPDTLKFTGAEEIERQAREIDRLTQAMSEAWEQGLRAGLYSTEYYSYPRNPYRI